MTDKDKMQAAVREAVERCAREADEYCFSMCDDDFQRGQADAGEKVAAAIRALEYAAAALEHTPKSNSKADSTALHNSVEAFLRAHDASALAPDDVKLEATELDCVDDLRAHLSATNTEAMRLSKDLPLDVKIAGAEAIAVEHMAAKANYEAACDCWDAMIDALAKGGA